MSTAKKTPVKKAAASKKAAAARGEKTDDPKTIEFRGLELVVPAKVPGTLLWDFNEVLAGDERSLTGIINLIGSLVGAEQNQAVRSKVQEDGLDIEETIGALEGLLEEIFEAAGLSAGE
jgi:hypothetical protein